MTIISGVKSKIDTGHVVKKPPPEPGVPATRRPAYGSWPSLNMPFNVREKRHAAFAPGPKGGLSPAQQPLVLPPTKNATQGAKPKVDSGVILKKKQQVPMLPSDRRSAYGSWPSLNLPFNVRERRHPSYRPGMDRAQVKPRLVLPPPKNPTKGAKAKVDSGVIVKRKPQEQLEVDPSHRPAYGSWPRLNLPYNVSERRHPPFRPPLGLPGHPEKALVHLELLKHRKHFPSIRNASQLDGLY